MYKGRAAAILAIFALMAMVSVAVVSPAFSDDSSADMDGTSLVVVYNNDKDIVIHAKDKTDFKFNVYSNYSDSRILYVYASSNNGDIDVDTSDAPVPLESNKYKEITLHISADKYAHQGNYIVHLTFDVRDSANNSEQGTQDFNITVKSSLSASDQYNRFLGTWDNDMPEPFDQAWFAALVTGIVWILIGFIVRLFAVPIVMRIIMKKDDPDYHAMKVALTRMCFVIIVLNGIGKAIRVLGLSEEVIDSVNVIFYICYVFVGVVVAWRLYILIINILVKKIGVRDFIPGGSKSDFESLKPLFMYIGEILLSVIAVGMVMSILGFDMAAIITGAGIVSLGITLGAQNVLGQFFSGLVLLSTRPFKKGDLITINGGTITYRVRKVNIMQTELENWDNTDITMVPNSMLTSGIVKNITKDTLKCKIHVFISVGYGNDLAFVRSTMLEVANENARVIKDGSVSKPSTRVTEFEDSNIQLRLSVYVDDFNDSGVIGGELRQAMYYKFLQKGITIDYTNIIVRPAEPEKDSE